MQPVAYNQEIAAFLNCCGVDSADLREGSPALFFCFKRNDELAGVVGVEVNGDVGLLRSLAVTDHRRSGGTGKALVADAETWAASCGLTWFYLLTNTAATYFGRLGYEVLDRAGAPSGIRKTKQFSSLCPDSAIFMGKRLEACNSCNLPS